MSCARYRALISRYLDGELTPRQRADLLHHIETCASCSSALAKYRQSEVLLKRLPESRTPTDLKRSVMREARRNRRPRGWRRLPWLLGGGRVTARLAGLVVLGLLAAITGLVVLPRRDSADGASLLFVPPATTTPAYIVPPTSTPAVVDQPVAPPRLIASEPAPDATAVDTGAALLLRFDQAMDRRSVEKAFRVDPPTTGQFSWDADNELRFNPDKSGLLRGITYTVSLSSGAFSLTGTTLPAGTVLQFSTLPAPTLLASWPPAGASAVPITATMVLTFSQPMEMGSVGVTVHGPAVGAKLAAPPWSVGGDLQWSPDGTTAYFQPALPLPPGLATVEVAAGARDKLGGRLPAYSWPFSVAAPPRSVSFTGPRLEVLSDAPGAEPQISFAAPAETGARTGPAVDLSAYHLPRATFESLLPLLLDPSSGAAGAPWTPLATAALPAARTWRPDSARLSDGSSARQTDFLPREPGIYLLSAAVAGGQGDQKLVLLTDTGLIVFSDGGHWTVWASRYDHAAIGGTRIVLYDQGGTILAESLVDSDGFFRIDLPSGTIPAAAAAMRDGPVGLTLIDRARVTPADEQAPGALVLTDQAAYHPGDIFNFKAFLPGAGGDQSQIVAVGLLDPQGRSIGQQRLKADKLGAFSGSFALAPGAQPGRYSLQLAAGNESFTQSLNVVPATNAAAELALAASFSTASVAPGGQFTATIRAGYSAASVAADLPITATLRSASGAALGVYTGTTSADGLLDFALQAPEQPDGDHLYLQAEAGGVLGGMAFAALPLLHSAFTLTQQLSAYSFEPGQAVTVTATLRDGDGQPVEGRELTLVLSARGDDNMSDTPLASVVLPTNVAGSVEAVFPLALQGSFVISTSAADTPGPVVARDRFWVFGGQSASWALPFGLASSLQFTPDKPAYGPGDTAHLLVQAGEQGSGLLLARYGDQVVGQQTLTLVATGSVVAVPIPAAPPLTGALHLTVLRFDGPAATLSRTDFDLPIVQPSAAQIEIALDHGDGQYAPGQIVQARIALTGTDGLPLDGQIAVALLPADRLSGDTPGATSVGMMNADAPGSVLGVANAPVAGVTGYWNASLAVGSGGIVTATIPLPSDPQDWRLQVWSFTVGGVSSGAAAVQATAPVEVEWSPVGHMVQGDTANIQAVVRNTRTVTVPLEVRLLAEGGLTLDQATAGQRSLTLQPGESQTLSWSVAAANSSGGRLLLDVGWPAGAGWAAATVRQADQVDVLEYGVQDRQARSGALRGDEQVGMVLPASVAPNGAELEITCDPTLTGVLVRAFAAQLDAGRDAGASASAAAARLLANAALRDLANRSLLDPDNLPAAMNSERALDLQFLYAAQDASGGWAESPSGAPSIAVTASVLRALWLLQGTPADTSLAPSEVDATTTQRGIIWLRAALRPAPVLPGADALGADNLPPATRAHALYVLALYDAASEEDARALLGQVANLDSAAQGWLALALSRLGLGSEAALLLDRLTLDKPSATASPDADALTAGAVALQALIRADPAGERPNSGDAADLLLGLRSGAGWDGFAAGETLLALAGYAAAHPDSTVPFSYQVFVNGTLLREVQVARGSGSLQVVVPGAALHTGQNSVRLQSSDGRIYYSLLARTVLFSSTRPISSASDSGFDGSLLRGYQTDGAALTPAVGDLVTVVNTITVGSALGPIQLSDRLPGALEPLGDYALTTVASGYPITTQANAANDGLAVLAAAPGDTQLILPALAPGTYRLTYRAIVVHTGNYTALPATLLPAGATPILARSATAELLVTK